jgi:hypothetical protein
VSRRDERPTFADKAYTKEGPEAATDKSCKKRKEGYIELRKRTKSWTALAKSKGAFGSKQPGMKKGAPGIFESRKLHDSKLSPLRKGGKHGT